MTITNTVEIIRQQFPEYGDTQIIKDLDMSQKLFAEETRSLRKIDIRTTPFTSLPASEATEFGIKLPLPIRCGEVIAVAFFGEDDAPIVDALGWSYSNGFLYINDLGILITTLPSDLKKITIEYIGKPDTLTDLDDAFEVPEESHYGVMCDVITRYWLIKGQLQNAQFWRGEYMRYRQSAKRQVNLTFGGNIINKGAI